jgi:hypothetical protein
LPGSEDVIGHFNEPCFFNVDGDLGRPFSDLVSAARERWFDAREHSKLPLLALLQEGIDPPAEFADRDKPLPIVQWFGEDVRPKFPGAQTLLDSVLRNWEQRSGTPADLEVTFWQEGDGVWVTADYNTRHWTPIEIESLLLDTRTNVERGLRAPYFVPTTGALAGVVQ